MFTASQNATPSNLRFKAERCGWSYCTKSFLMRCYWLGLRVIFLGIFHQISRLSLPETNLFRSALFFKYVLCENNRNKRNIYSLCRVAWLCVNGMRDISDPRDGMQFGHLMMACKLNWKISRPLALRIQSAQTEILESNEVLKQINVSIAGVAGAN